MELIRELPAALDAVDPLVIVAVLVALVLIVAFLVVAMGRRRMRIAVLEGTFGAEYWRTVGNEGSRRRAEESLARRAERRRGYEIRALSDRERDAFRARWQELQAGFVDGPAFAARAAKELVGEVAASRGYPDADLEQCLDDISVDHPELVADLRGSQPSNSRNWTTTEHQRESFVHARALFGRLLAEGDGGRAEKSPMSERVASVVDL